MACECAATCKADIAAKQTGYLVLINALNTSGVASDKSQIFTYIMDDINRLRGIYKRMEEMQAIIAAEAAISPTGYLPESVKYGILQELLKIKETSEADCTALAAILGITIPSPAVIREENNVIYIQ